MRRSSRSRWLSGLGAAVLIGGLVVANYGGGVTPAGAVPPASNPGNPFQAILEKLDEILAAIGGLGGGGGNDGNHTLRWDTNNPSASRFVTAFPGAVLDKNTGLVWEQAPDATPRTWASATIFCVAKTVGGTVGWRLPSVVELKSVQDPSLPAPFVPASVFTNVLAATYWSATPFADFAPLTFACGPCASSMATWAPSLRPSRTSSGVCAARCRSRRIEGRRAARGESASEHRKRCGRGTQASWPPCFG